MQYLGPGSLAAVLVLTACSTGGMGIRSKEVSPAHRLAMTNVKLGMGYLRQGKRIFAMEKLQRALQLNPRLGTAHHSIALLYQQIERDELADKHFLRALELDPEDSKLHNNYGTFLCQQYQLDKAEEHFLKAVSNPLYETPAQALENAGLCALRKLVVPDGPDHQVQPGYPDRVKAENYLYQALQLDPKLPVALMVMAKINFEKGKYLLARAYTRRFEQIAQHTAQTLWIAIQSENALGNKTAAENYSKQLRLRFPDADEANKLSAADHSTVSDHSEASAYTGKLD